MSHHLIKLLFFLLLHITYLYFHQSAASVQYTYKSEDDTGMDGVDEDGSGSASGFCSGSADKAASESKENEEEIVKADDYPGMAAAVAGSSSSAFSFTSSTVRTVKRVSLSIIMTV